MLQAKGEKVRIHSSLKDSPLFDLCLMAFPGFEFHLALQIDISGRQDSLIQIGIKGSDGHIQFRMVGDDLIRGLPLCNQRGDDHILLPEFMLCDADAGTGIMETLPVFPVSELGIIAVFMGDGAMVDSFWAAVTDIRSLIQTGTPLSCKVGAGLVAGRAGGAFDAAQDDPATGIGFLTVITVDTEVVGIIESAFMIPVTEAVQPDLF